MPRSREQVIEELKQLTWRYSFEYLGNEESEQQAAWTRQFALADVPVLLGLLLTWPFDGDRFENTKWEYIQAALRVIAMESEPESALNVFAPFLRYAEIRYDVIGFIGYVMTPRTARSIVAAR